MKGDSTRPPAPALTELREAYETGNLVIFAGAGVSAAAGLPGWKKLVDLLSAHAQTLEVPPAQLQEIAELAASRQYINALSALKVGLGASEFCTFVERQLDDARADEPSVARAIAALAPSLRAVLTTNIDHLLERAFAGRWPTLARATGDIASRKHFILKLHGTLLDRKSWIFTREDYDRAMFADPLFRDAFAAFFHSVHLLFVGYGLADDDFDLHLGRIRAFAGDQPPRHFALVPADTVTPFRRHLLDKAGVRLIPYSNSDGRHTAVVEILGELARPTVARGGSTAVPARPLSPDEVTKILQEEGFEVLPPSRESSSEPRLFRTGESRVGQRLRSFSSLQVELLARLLRCIHVPTTIIRLDPRAFARSPSDKGELAAVALPPGGGFVLYLPVDAMGPASGKWFSALAGRLVPRGGSVRVFGYEAPAPPLAAGLEGLGLRETLEPLVRDALRAHAQRCHDAWTDQDEQGFVSTRAKLQPTGQVLPVGEALDHALAERQRVLVLGDFGTGKSTHLKRRAFLMAKAFLEGNGRAPAPLFLPLRGMELNLELLVATHVPGLTEELFRLTVELDMALPLFDGLDEMRLAPQQIAGAIHTLLEAFSSKETRAVLTSRKTLFSELGLPREQLPGALSSLALLELEDLDRSEIQEFVTRRAPSAEETARVLEKIRETHDLTSLSKRPVLLELIVRSQKRLSSGEMNAARLYEVAAEDWLKSRESIARHVDHDRRLAFARGLARKLFASGDTSATLNEVAELVLNVHGDRSLTSIDEAVLEVHTAVFLAHDEERGGFQFAHKSFLEYFLAVDISTLLDEGMEAALDLPRLTPDVVSFLSGMEGWERRKAQLRRILTTAYRQKVSENALFALYLAAAEREEEGEALGSLLEDELPARAQLAGAQLARVDMPWVSLPEADLSGADLSGARLGMAVLRRARLDRARLAQVILDGAALDGARFMDADLFHASMVDASLEGVRWDGADEEGLVTLHADPLRTGEEAQQVSSPSPMLHTRSGAVQVVVWSPDRRRLASGSEDGTVRVWEASSGKLLHELKGDAHAVTTVAYPPDGARLASGSDDGTVRVWEASSGKLLHELKGHARRVWTVAYAPDGARLASGSEDGTVRVWEASSGKLLHKLKGHAD